MSLRKIIEIEEALCNGCGACETGCAEGALKVIDGKARLVKEQFCDGFGDCMGECPTGALKIVERESTDFDIAAVRTHLLATEGRAAVARMEAANDRHANAQAHAHTPVNAPASFPPMATPTGAPAGACPGSMMRTFNRAPGAAAPTPASTSAASAPGHAIQSDLAQWPVQLHLLQPGAPFFKNKELVVMSDCGPVASADVHWRFLRGRSIAIACPKLDDTTPYVDKLAAILSDPTIPKVIVVRMQVPCCGGLTRIVEQAIARSGRDGLKAEETILSLQGDVLATRSIA